MSFFRKTVSVIAAVSAVAMCFGGCKGDTADPTGEATPTPYTDLNITPEPTVTIEPDQADIMAEKWVAVEIELKSSKEYSTTERDTYALPVNGVFKNRTTGTELKIPAFFDGDNIWRIRFAGTETGIWDYTVECDSDESLAAYKGSVGVSSYSGDLDVYKHGFVTARYGKKYFTYDDGTPFFYLGDTHWTMFKEEFDSAGDHAGNTGAASHFKYIVDKRVEQGYTVYQSEPIDAPFDLSAGKISRRTLNGFAEADKYFQYLAEKGLVHANAQFFFTSQMSDKLASDTEYLEIISRYWAARWGAYPVMWTLAQECDNDFYYENGTNSFSWKWDDNPWVKVAEYIHKYDAYSHPLTGHQEGSSNVSVTGAGADILKKYSKGEVSNKGISAFASEEVTARTGHNWYGAQWKQNITVLPDFYSAKDYWASNKIAVNYEDRYAFLWTKDYGARVRGWISYLNGFFGYAYGCADQWYYKSNFEMNADSPKRDGLETITKEEKQMQWSESIELPSGYQAAYMKKFFRTFDWWNLVPDFNENAHFEPSDALNTLYSVASIGNDVTVLLLYKNGNKDGGSIIGLDKNTKYTVKWFNPRTGEFEGEERTEKPADLGNGKHGFKVEKADDLDWVVLVTKVGR